MNTIKYIVQYVNKIKIIKTNKNYNKNNYYRTERYFVSKQINNWLNPVKNKQIK